MPEGPGPRQWLLGLHQGHNPCALGRTARLGTVLSSMTATSGPPGIPAVSSSAPPTQPSMPGTQLASLETGLHRGVFDKRAALRRPGP